jgi:predicted RNA-binding Zn-ribbon protein involved in translation (DUF1610 family)
MIDVDTKYNELACANCGENSITKITMRGVVLYICWDCMGDLLEELYRERAI